MSTQPRPGAAPRDARLPGLAQVLDHDALQALLRDSLPECRDGAEPAGITHVDLQYLPGQRANLLVKVRLSVPDGRTLRQKLFLKVLPPGEEPTPLPESVERRYAEWRRTRVGRRESPLAQPFVRLGDGVAAYCFPADPVVQTLVDAVDPSFMRRALHRAWQPRGVRVREVRARTLAYTPESRAALAYEVLAEDKTTAVPELRHLVGKLQFRKPASRLFAGHWAVWRETFGRVSIVPPVGYVATADLSLQEFLTGERLSDFAERAVFTRHVREAARSIAVVGSSVLPVPHRREAEKECRTVDRWVKVVSRLRADLAPRIHAHGEALKAAIEERFVACGTCHADFHLANVMVDGEGVVIIDWDQVAHGDPLLDAGRFLGALRITSLRVTGEPNGLADVGDAFLSSYLKHSGADERRLRLYESLALLMSAASPFRLQRVGWEQQAEQLLAESEAALAHAVSGPPVAVSQERTRLSDEARREWATDRTLAQALLVPLLREQHDPELEVTECEPKIHHEDSEVLHVKWLLKGWRGAKRWRGRAEGIGIAGHTGSALLRRLEAFHAALDEGAAERDAAVEGEDEPVLVMPRPLGLLGGLAMVAVTPERGKPLTSYLGSSGEGRVLRRLGLALGRLARLDVPLEKRRGVRRESGAVERRVDVLREAGDVAPETLARIEDVRVKAERRAGELAPPLAPTPRGAHLRDFVVRQDSIGLRLVRELVSAPQPVAVASLISAVASHVHRGEASEDACSVLRDAFCQASGMDAADLAPWEALLLLRRATRRLIDEPADERALRLLEDAGALIG